MPVGKITKYFSAVTIVSVFAGLVIYNLFGSRVNSAVSSLTSKLGITA